MRRDGEGRARDTGVLGTIAILAGIAIWTGYELVAQGVRRLLGGSQR